MRREHSADEFARLHRAFVVHLGFATGFAWFATLAAALRAPWVRNIRALIEPTAARPEATGSYLFSLPLLMLAALVCVVVGEDTMRRGRLLKNQNLEFGFAAVVAFVVFCAAVQRAVAVCYLGS
ncbi:MAG: hypothetical protein JO048_03220 [Methylobacteriaceae bacterium]|nr:hypothetical protein [Methylobacteriaceae bacterium]